jgi:P27 family predicted phage terminase small subunit
MTARTKLPKPPAHLSRDMAAWWRHVTANYQLEEHHLRLLQLACEAWDRGTGARETLRKEGVTYIDRFGAPRKHPAVAVEEQARIGFTRLVRELNLEGDEPAGGRR